VGGELTVEGDILLWVRDHGPGIPEAELETIFEAFVQSSQTKDGSGGTGLGLAISRKIMQPMAAPSRPQHARRRQPVRTAPAQPRLLRHPPGDLALQDTSPALLV
jgi:hypothetical protein